MYESLHDDYTVFSFELWFFRRRRIRLWRRLLRFELFPHGKYSSGSVGSPLTLTSKCKCGPVVNGPAPGVPGRPPE